MLNVLKGWFNAWFSDEEAVYLLFLLLAGFAVVLLFGGILAPVLAALVIAYLLEGPIDFLHRHRFRRLVAAALVWTVFVVALLVSIVALVPLLSKQFTQIFLEIPQIASRLQAWVLTLPQAYPNLFTDAQVQELISGMSLDFGDLRQVIVGRSKALGVGLTYLVIYLILVPLMVFFMLKDKDKIRGWMRGFLPDDIGLISRVWGNVDRQLPNYIRGKVVEILIVWFASYLTFSFLELKFAMLLATATGLSVLVPYVGATLMTIPVAAVAYVQFGWGGDFALVMIVYGIIQFIDGNILVPLLFSEAVNLHPVAIITAILLFGGLWGLWGVFFAIPLATLIKAVINAWPSQSDYPDPEQKVQEDS